VDQNQAWTDCGLICVRRSIDVEQQVELADSGPPHSSSRIDDVAVDLDPEFRVEEPYRFRLVFWAGGTRERGAASGDQTDEDD
jgi:hypothetical protein